MDRRELLSLAVAAPVAAIAPEVAPLSFLDKTISDGTTVALYVDGELTETFAAVDMPSGHALFDFRIARHAEILAR